MKKSILLLSLLLMNVVSYAATEISIPAGVLISSGLDVSFVAQFACFTAVILLWTILCGWILNRYLWMPTIAGQIIGGVIIGPSFVDIAHRSIAIGDFNFSFAKPIEFIDRVANTIYSIAASDLFIFVILLISAAFTVAYLLWIAGHETDINDIVKVGVAASSAGVFGAVLPIGLTVGSIMLGIAGNFTFIQSMALGIIFSATSVSIPVAMLFSRNKMHLKSSKATLGAAIIDDILAVVLLSLFFMTVQSGFFGSCDMIVCKSHQVALSDALLYMAISFGVIFCAGYFFIPLVLKKLEPRGRSYLVAPVANGVMLLYFAFAELVGGFAGITGAYFAGLFHRMGDMRHQAEKTISPYVNAFLLPLFLGSIGLQIDISILSFYDWVVVTVLLIVAIFSKLLGCGLATAFSNFSDRRVGYTWNALETYIFGSSMVARGEVGLVIATILNGANIIESHQYVVAVMVIILTTIASPIMLSIGFFYYDKQGVVSHEDDYYYNIGFFKNIGTSQMFNIIIGQLENSHLYKTTIQFSQGRRIVNLEGKNVKIILAPRKGIIFEGDQGKIEEILEIVKRALSTDISRLTQA